MNMIFQSLYYQYILDKFHFFKSPKTFRVIITIILCCPCYMPKYVPRLEGIMHSPSGSCIISGYNMDNTILLYKYDSIHMYDIIWKLFTLCNISLSKLHFRRRIGEILGEDTYHTLYYNRGIDGL